MLDIVTNIQIVFYDQTEVLMTPDQRYLTYVDKKEIYPVGTNAEMAKRLKYAKEILSQLLNGQSKR